MGIYVSELIELILTPSKTEVYVGEEVDFSGRVILPAKAPFEISIPYTVYVNGQAVHKGSLTIPTGNSVGVFNFGIKFNEPGTFDVYVEVDVPDVALKFGRLGTGVRHKVI